MTRARAIACGIGLVLMSAAASPGGDTSGGGEGRLHVPGATLEALGFEALQGWADDDHTAAFATFLRSCRAMAAGASAIQPAEETGTRLALACEAALRWEGTARAYFEQHFTPHRVQPETGRPFLTGYYEPEYDGAREADATFSAPLRARPSDHVRFEAGEMPPGWPEGLTAGRRTVDGYRPYPDRGAIEDGALGDAAPPLVFLRHPAEAFIIHVQGSARIRLAEGGVMRVGYAGRNGHPYTSIGRLLVERGRMSREEMSLERLLGWLQDPENADEARALMRENRSYIFFAENTALAPDEGPVGGAGVPLTPHRSLAIDRSIWSYGLPVWLQGVLPDADGAEQNLARLLIAQDTGAAIIGPARGDYFTGSGARAGDQAGFIRHRPDFVVLLPRPLGAQN
jgi:membrane-bound lytic murein transglycosylase A